MILIKIIIYNQLQLLNYDIIFSNNHMSVTLLILVKGSYNHFKLWVSVNYIHRTLLNCSCKLVYMCKNLGNHCFLVREVPFLAYSFTGLSQYYNNKSLYVTADMSLCNFRTLNYNHICFWLTLYVEI